MKISIIGGFDLGCHRFSVIKDSIEVQGRDRCGECSTMMSMLRFAPKTTDDRMHETVIHEIVEAVNGVYCADKMEHEEIIALACGLAQVLKSLGITFTVD